MYVRRFSFAVWYFWIASAPACLWLSRGYVTRTLITLQVATSLWSSSLLLLFSAHFDLSFDKSSLCNYSLHCRPITERYVLRSASDTSVLPQPWCSKDYIHTLPATNPIHNLVHPRYLEEHFSSTFNTCKAPCAAGSHTYLQRSLVSFQMSSLLLQIALASSVLSITYPNSYRITRTKIWIIPQMNWFVCAILFWTWMA